MTKRAAKRPGMSIGGLMRQQSRLAKESQKPITADAEAECRTCLVYGMETGGACYEYHHSAGHDVRPAEGR